MERHSRDCWKPDGMIGAPDALALKGLSQTSILPGLKNQEVPLGWGPGNEAVTMYFQVCGKAF